jgi:hypothetical protein
VQAQAASAVRGRYERVDGLVDAWVKLDAERVDPAHAVLLERRQAALPQLGPMPTADADGRIAASAVVLLDDRQTTDNMEHMARPDVQLALRQPYAVQQGRALCGGMLRSQCALQIVRHL